ncbi:MAG: VWA domain-containing protein [bacterium]|nr:VWA domain-containing protein [bacterium]
MNSKLHIIATLCLSASLALYSCVSSGGETIPLEFDVPTGDITPIDGIPNDALAKPNPSVIPTIELPDFAHAIVSGSKDAQIAEFYLPGIKSPTNNNWLYLVGTGGAHAIPQNVWVSVDGKPKGCLALNNSNSEIEAPIAIDFIFLVNNSNNMKEAGDMLYRTLDEWTDALKGENISMAYYCVGYGGGDTKGVNGACNRSTASELKAYLSREGVSGVSRTMGFNDIDALEQLAQSQYQNCDGECGVEALKFANEAFAGKFHPNAIRMYLNITDEPNQPGGDPEWSVESIKAQDQWHAGSGTIHTLFSGNQEFSNQVNEYEHPWLLSEYTGGYTTACDSKLTGITLEKLPLTGSLQNCTKIRIANVDDYMDGKYHDVKLTILSGDKMIQASKTFKILFSPAK